MASPSLASSKRPRRNSGKKRSSTKRKRNNSPSPRARRDRRDGGLAAFLAPLANSSLVNSQNTKSKGKGKGKPKKAEDEVSSDAESSSSDNDESSSSEAKALVPKKKVYDTLNKQHQRETGGGTATYQQGDFVVNPGAGRPIDEDYVSIIRPYVEEYEKGSAKEKKSTIVVSMCYCI